PAEIFQQRGYSALEKIQTCQPGDGGWGRVDHSVEQHIELLRAAAALVAAGHQKDLLGHAAVNMQFIDALALGFCFQQYRRKYTWNRGRGQDDAMHQVKLVGNVADRDGADIPDHWPLRVQV